MIDELQKAGYCTVNNLSSNGLGEFKMATVDIDVFNVDEGTSKEITIRNILNDWLISGPLTVEIKEEI